MRVPRHLLTGLVALALVTLSSGILTAQERNREFGYHGFGPRVGLSVNPDQVFIGAHIDLGEIARQIRLQPNAEIGFGDDITLIQVDGDFHYRFLEDWDVWNPYAGAGAGIAHWSFDYDGPEVEGIDIDTSSTEFQIHLIGGVEKYISSGKFFVETKLGIVDESPDWKFLAGWTIVAN
jgi:hypothetical protein